MGGGRFHSFPLRGFDCKLFDGKFSWASLVETVISIYNLRTTPLGTKSDDLLVRDNILVYVFYSI